MELFIWREERKHRKQKIPLLIQHKTLRYDKFTVNFYFLGQTESLGWVLSAHLVGDLLLLFSTYPGMHLRKIIAVFRLLFSQQTLQPVIYWHLKKSSYLKSFSTVSSIFLGFFCSVINGQCRHCQLVAVDILRPVY